ncbi:MAG: carbon starvation protein A [Muribaculaceae bacterium]|nr:carbon starvation protein A [Muribaculaceae bacterium]
MSAFLIALAVLVGGYFIYGALVDRIIGTSASTPMPANTRADGIDFIPMPTWKVFLIQFLNIAGLGPIFGAIMGIMFGPAAFLWIVFGTIFAGAVHDFLSGVISIRMGGASLPEIVGRELGPGIKQVMRAFSVILLVLVGAVFVLTPADILAGMTPDWLDRTVWIAIIFTYYLLATLLPIDKLIGNLYPLFGFALLFMAVGLLAYLLFSGIEIPVNFSDGLANRFSSDPASHPVFPMMFVSIACGAISGFHATQSPMMARCLTNEKLARPIFYGAMVTEGIVALIWAAAAIAFAGGYEQLGEYMAAHGNSAGALVNEISITWLGTAGGILALLGVVAAPVSTGDTALRSARLIVADFMNLSQKSLLKRMAVCLPIFGATFLLMFIDFNVLWRYFAWSNQTLAVFTLWAVTVYLARKHKAYIVSLCPALFMTAVSVSYLLFARSPEGFGLPLPVAIGAGIAVATIFLALFLRWKSTADVKPILD